MIDPKPEESVSEQMQGELEPLPAKGLQGADEEIQMQCEPEHICANPTTCFSAQCYGTKRWDGGDIGEVLKHGRE